MSKTKTKTQTEMTCDLSDIVDFIGCDLIEGREVTVTVNGTTWTVLRGGPEVQFDYAGTTLKYLTHS